MASSHGNLLDEPLPADDVFVRCPDDADDDAVDDAEACVNRSVCVAASDNVGPLDAAAAAAVEESLQPLDTASLTVCTTLFSLFRYCGGQTNKKCLLFLVFFFTTP